MKEVLARFKFRGDAELVFAFAPLFINAFHQYYRRTPAVLVPIPLSEEFFTDPFSVLKTVLGLIRSFLLFLDCFSFSILIKGCITGFFNKEASLSA